MPAARRRASHVPWSVAYAAAVVASHIGPPDGSLLVLDEVCVARRPMRFDDARARSELGYTSRPAAAALARAGRALCGG